MNPKKQLDEKIQTGGGTLGTAYNVDPVEKKATLPASNLGNGETMNKIADVTPGQSASPEETDSQNNVKPTKDAAGSNKASVAAKPSAASASMKEDMEAMFNGEELSEDFKEKATVIFEAAVSARAEQIEAELVEQYQTALAEQVTTIEEELTAKIDQYLSYVAEQWVQENQVAIESSLKSELTEEFISGLKSLFEQHYISVPQERFDVVEEMMGKLEEMQAKLDGVMEQNIALTNQLSEATRQQILADVSEGLAATQVEKLATLAEGVEFDTADNFRKKLNIVKENYFPQAPTTSKTQSLLEEVNEGAQVTTAQTNSYVANYAKAISRTVKK